VRRILISTTLRTIRAGGWVAVLAVAAKTLLIGLLVMAVVWPDLGGLKGKAAGARLVVYPIGAMAIPIWWAVRARLRQREYDRRPTPDADGPRAYPWTADLLITLPWLLDVLGNRLDLFDAVTWWDDLMHFVNWALLTAGVLLASARRPASGGLLVMLSLGFGTTAAVLWEIGEYYAFIRDSPELQTAYTDTLADLGLGSLGALLAGLAVWWARSRQASGSATEHPAPWMT
jgi:hypothetical protein